MLCLFCLEENWKSEKERKKLFDEFLNPIIEKNQNVLMAFGVRLMVTWPLGQANYNRELPLAAWGLGVFDPLSSLQKGQY